MTSGKRNKVTLLEVISEYERQYLGREALAHPKAVEHLDGYRGILEYLGSKGLGRKNFRHYASRDRIASILEDSAFYLTDGSNWNDKYDRERFNPSFSDYKRFGICFSATTSECIAMWMLYGGTDGNGTMINFDKRTLSAAMSADEYECGYFDDRGFNVVDVLDASMVDFKLMDVLYFGSGDGGDKEVIITRSGESRQAEIAREAFYGMEQITKHKSWSYEAEVRLVATVGKSALGNKASKITSIKVPLRLDDGLKSERVFDSPVSDGNGEYLDSELLGTIDWDFCSGCKLKTASSLQSG
ncbi:DUF2971 domain-containing protein [Adlercreutzia sp. ZJ242]|uniref:DUF2971 domain-containing protein n=1 Tax=Adlercreutzia sp. ZJ242 TaxID=2709409 RepID=UPI0013EA321E|nr:DUF2971 domain-containing protein [Adlercreutzia sp. ZJ242]